MKKPFQPTRWTLLFLLMSAMLILMGGAAVAPALPSISLAFPDASETMVSLIITLPSLAVALTGFFLGALSDRIGRMPVLVVSILLFTVAGTSGYYLDSLTAILVGRFIVGIGIGGITTTVTSLIAEYYSGVTRAKVLGYQAAAMGVGVLILETSGGFLAGVSWRISFLIYAIGAVILLGVVLFMREPSHEDVDAPKIIQGPENTKVTTLNKVELLTLYLTLFVGVAVFFLMPTKLPYLLTGMFEGNTAIISGALLGCMGLCSTIASINVWRFVRRFNRQIVLGISFLCTACGMLLIGAFTIVPVVILGIILVGFANGLLMPCITMWLTEIVPIAIMGKATGGFSVFLNMGNFFSSLLAIPLLVLVGTYAGVFAAGGVIALLLVLLIFGQLFLKKRQASAGSLS